jgi:hypothetical protein
VIGEVESPIAGGDGNREWLVAAEKPGRMRAGRGNARVMGAGGQACKAGGAAFRFRATIARGR